MPPPKRPLKPHIRRQIRDAALAANPIRDPLQDFTVQGYEASLIKGMGKAVARDVESGMLIPWDGVRPLGMLEEVVVDRHDILHLLKTVPDHAFSVASGSGVTPASTSKAKSLPAAAPPSPDPSEAFSDLPSDAEDTFFFSSDEAQDYQRGKKRRRMETGREERMKEIELKRERARVEQDMARVERQRQEEEKLVAEKIEGREPPPEILHTMRLTLTSLLASPNPQILELRILTHHGADPRFAFLRADGKWRGYWESMKLDAGKKDCPAAKVVEVTVPKVGLGGLMGAYAGSDSGDSGEDLEQEECPGGAGSTGDADLGTVDLPSLPLDDAEFSNAPEQEVPPPPDVDPPPPTPDTAIVADKEDRKSDLLHAASEEAKAARRAKAKAWAESRKAQEASLART